MRLCAQCRGPSTIVLHIEGRIVAPDLESLEREGQRWLRQGYRLVLELSGVRFIDLAGVELLRRWTADHELRLSGASRFIGLLLENHGLQAIKPSGKEE